MATDPTAHLSDEARRHLLALHRLTTDMTLEERAFAATMVASAGNAIAAFSTVAAVPASGPAAELFGSLMLLLFTTGGDV